MSVADEDMHKAIDNIARTEDGQLLYLYFQKTLCSTVANATADALCALPMNEGRRKYAAELMALMAKGIEESAGSRTADRTVIFARREPSASGRHVTARQFLRDNADADPAG